MRTYKEHSQGTDNVLTNPGFDGGEEPSAKTLLGIKLNELIGRRGLSQTATIRLTGMALPKASQIGCYKLQDISSERFIQAVASIKVTCNVTG
ncbi:XRE family transcriptional regulator [Nitrosospira multiformis]|nr:XRE family transcriptional regulator [Nitrosospira multiformis]SDZ93290.1 Helix-turn-helix domain-containing protein [Nitrosospira multiformis]SEF58379.1 Helix-turn-helix domain-containing protein [Nitrosospira multiformis ATCC 25196]